MNKHMRSCLSMLAAGLLAAGGAWARGSDDASVDCPKGKTASVNTSGTSSARALGTRHAKMRTAATSTHGSDLGMYSSLSRCTSNPDRIARAQCVRTAWESKHGSPDNDNSIAVASSGTGSARRPCP